ncbi:MAG TPA: rRNA maturation RNase YbeY [Polyangiales bacterium]|nr:rRNA maturation RNase YbeY [Polyangiales bacterium]
MRQRAERMLVALKLKKAELSVLLCDDRAIHALNRTHRKKNKPTDVLAFALGEGEVLPGAEGVLGDVVISLDTAQRQADDRGHTLWDEVTLLLAHGLLHLIGYDHGNDEEERLMNARADMLIAAAKSRPQGRAKTVDKRGKTSAGQAAVRVRSAPKRAVKPRKKT